MRFIVYFLLIAPIGAIFGILVPEQPLSMSLTILCSFTVMAGILHYERCRFRRGR